MTFVTTMILRARPCGGWREPRVKPLSGMVFLLAAMIVVVGPAHRAWAQGQATGPWKWTVAPYVWGSGLAGRVATVPGLPPVDVDAGFGDILDNLELGGFVGFAGHDGRYGISGDIQYIRLSNTSTTPGPAFSSATVEAETAIVTLMGEYQLNTRADTKLWAMGGLRYWSVKTDVAYAAGLSPAQSAGGSDNWVDPVIGVRGRRDISDRIFLTGWAYAGGFGAGSEEMYDLFGGLGFEFSKALSGVAGYRWMSVDRVSGSFVYDTSQEGMLAGVRFNF